MDKTAIIVVDMLNDFVTGALTCERAIAAIEPNQRLIAAAHKAGVPVIFSCDSHLEGIDHELTLWGAHAMRGTEGAEIIPELAPTAADYVVLKRRYSGFCDTSLDQLLRELGAETVVITGIHSHLCVCHTAADAYMKGYAIIAAEDAINAFTQENYDQGMSIMKDFYAAQIMPVDEIIGMM